MEQSVPSVNKQLLSRLTHHVRNPFNGIIGFADLLINHFDKLTDNDVRKHMTVVLQLSKKALLRSENLSWWLKFYTNNLTPLFQDVDLNEVVKDEIAYFAMEISKQQLTMNIRRGEHSIVYSDKVMLQAIIRNAIFNVIEFSVADSEVDLSLSIVKSKLQLSITNTFRDDPSEEALAFAARIGEKEMKTEDMPDTPGLWCIKTLSHVLNLDPKLEFNGKRCTLTLTLS